MTDQVLDVIGADGAVALVRLDDIPDAAALATSLCAGGIRAIEFAFTNPSVAEHLSATRRRVAMDVPAGSGATGTVAVGTVVVGTAGTVAAGAVAAGAGTVAASTVVVGTAGTVAAGAGAVAAAAGAGTIKVFPAQAVGPAHFRHLAGPFSGVPLIASGGSDVDNARSYLDAGALAVTAGSSVIARASVSARDWASVTSRAREFVQSLR